MVRGKALTVFYGILIFIICVSCVYAIIIPDQAATGGGGIGDITGVTTNGIYLTGGCLTGTCDLLMNESELNNTIDARATGNISGDGVGFNQTDSSLNSTGQIVGANISYLQRRVDETCAAGSSIRIIDINGNVTCEIDSNTQLSQEQVWNFMNVSAFFIFQVNWSNILNPFITAVDEIYINMIGTNATFNETKLNETIDLRTASTTYLPWNITTITGTYTSGNLTSILTAKDGLSYNVTEAVGANPLTITVNFTGVVDFNQIIMRVYYIGGLGHEIEIGLWDYLDGVYEYEYGEITDMDGFAFFTINVLDASDHINQTNVSLIFNHVQTGKSSHMFYVDYVSLVDGFSTITTNEHDGLSGRDDNENHPWALPRDGTKQMSANWDQGAFNLTNTSSWWKGKINGSDVENAPWLTTSTNCNATNCNLLTNYLNSTGDPNTYISFATPDRTEHFSGGVEFLRMTEALGDKILIAPQNNDIDFLYYNSDGLYLFAIDSGNRRFGFNLPTASFAELYYSFQTNTPLFDGFGMNQAEDGAGSIKLYFDEYNGVDTLVEKFSLYYNGSGQGQDTNEYLAIMSEDPDKEIMKFDELGNVTVFENLTVNKDIYSNGILLTPNTDAQTLTFINDNITISGSGSSINISGVDTDTTYTAGNGIVLTGTQFNISAPTCAGGDFSTWNGTEFECDTPAGGSGGNASIGFPYVTVFSGASPESWTDLDLSSYIGGAKEAMVMLSFLAGTDYDATAVRRNGDTGDYWCNTGDANAYGVACGHGEANEIMVLMTNTNSSGVIEWIVENSVNPTTIVLMSYITI